jgi:hypothetical protein
MGVIGDEIILLEALIAAPTLGRSLSFDIAHMIPHGRAEAGLLLW